MIPLDYYQNDDVLFLGKDLLGKVLAVRHRRSIRRAMIIETESYKAPEDKASHAYNNRKTERNQVMYKEGGYAYVYLCYGIHYLFNIVTGPKELPHAVLIRGVLFENNAIIGPGKVTKKLGINKNHNEKRLDSVSISLEDHSYVVPPNAIEELPRIGIDYAEEYREKLWRFRIEKSALKKCIQ